MTTADSPAETHTEILPQLATLIEEVSGIEAAEVVPEAKISDLGIDSLSLIEFAVRTEDTFGVWLDDSTVLGFNTVGDAVEYISAHEGQ